MDLHGDNIEFDVDPDPIPIAIPIQGDENLDNLVDDPVAFLDDNDELLFVADAEAVAAAAVDVELARGFHRNDGRWMEIDETLLDHNTEHLPSFLLDFVRENCTCSSVLNGWSQQDRSCCRIANYCRSNPEQTFYTSPITGRTPLHEACLRGLCIHVIRALVDANALATTKRDFSGNTPLHLLFVDFSTRSRDPVEMDDIVQLLLQRNPASLAAAANGNGSTPLHMACSAPETMVHPSSLRSLLGANSSCASILNHRNQCALTLHCQRKNASVEVAAMLLDAFPGAIEVLDREHGWSPFHYACSCSNVNLIRFFIEQDPGCASLRASVNLRTGLHVLCQHHLSTDMIPTLQLMLQVSPGAALQTDVPTGVTPLHIICKSPSIDSTVVRLMLDTQPQAACISDAESYLPIHYACEVGAESEVISCLLAAYPSGAFALTRKHDTALSLACTCNKSVDTIRALIKANREALLKKNDYGFSPLHCVCRAFQPRMGIVQSLLEANPHCIQLRTNAGETPVHLASANPGTYVGVLQLLSIAQNQVHAAAAAAAVESASSTTTSSSALSSAAVAQEMDFDRITMETSSTSKIGNTPLHEACFRGSSVEHIETLAMGNPEWIVVKNNAGYSPLQILCKNGRINERIVTTFSRIAGPEIFSVVDSTGNTPLHSAVREGIDAASIRCLIRAFPDALNTKTWPYGNSPLHLVCFRRTAADVVRLIALATSNGSVSPVLEPNSAGLTPMAIAMDEFQSVCCSQGGRSGHCCCAKASYTTAQQRAFEVLATLVKILFYGAGHDEGGSLVMACVSLHRRGVRLHPSFIRRAIQQFPEEARLADGHGCYPLHIEASIPVEKMSLLDSSSTTSFSNSGGCCDGQCHKRWGILRLLLDTYPEATQVRTHDGEFPLGLMIQNGRSWNQTFSIALRNFPPALHWHRGADDDGLVPFILERVSKECGLNTLFMVIVSRPTIVGRGR